MSWTRSHLHQMSDVRRYFSVSSQPGLSQEVREQFLNHLSFPDFWLFTPCWFCCCAISTEQEVNAAEQKTLDAEEKLVAVEQKLLDAEEKLAAVEQKLLDTEKAWDNATEGSDMKAHYFRRMESAQRGVESAQRGVESAQKAVDHYSSKLFGLDSNREVICHSLTHSLTH